MPVLFSFFFAFFFTQPNATVSVYLDNYKDHNYSVSLQLSLTLEICQSVAKSDPDILLETCLYVSLMIARNMLSKMKKQLKM